MAATQHEPRRQGLWYEEKRDRWRVKLFKNGELFVRAYFRSYHEALSCWQEAKQQIAVPVEPRPLREATLFNRFLCRR